MHCMLNSNFHLLVQNKEVAFWFILLPYPSLLNTLLSAGWNSLFYKVDVP